LLKHSRIPQNPFPESVDPAEILDPERPVHLALPYGEPLDLHHTFRCGQLFRWRQDGDTWYGPYGSGSLAVRHTLSGVEVRALGSSVTAREAWDFLALGTPLFEYYQEMCADRWLAQAVQAVPGLRILRQDPWDCTAGYICSQNSNIPKIELSMERIARALGAVHRWPEGVEVASFPRPEVLAETPADELRSSALGYRCPYLVVSARMVARGEVELDRLRAAPYEEALEALLKLTGIGRKVADCIMVFSLDKPEAFPVDVWVRRVMHELYPKELARVLPDIRERSEKPLSAREYEAMVGFAWKRWGMLAGYAQQYLFHARRLDLIGAEPTWPRI
jgi:N-glycosylase/DNA lyase